MSLLASLTPLQPGHATPTVTIPLAPPENTVLPGISGTPTQGHTLIATSGNWTGNPSQTFLYQWRRCNTSGTSCSDIAGATASGYVLTATDVDMTVRVAVTASNSSGSRTATSLPTDVIAASADVDPVLQPIIAGLYDYGQLVVYDAVPPASTSTAYAANELGNGTVQPGGWTVFTFSQIQLVLSVQFTAAGTPLGARLADLNDANRIDCTVGGPASSAAVKLTSSSVFLPDRVTLTLTITAS